MKKILFILLLPLLFSTCSKDDLDPIDPTDPTAYDYRLDKITYTNQETNYEYDDIDKRYNSAEIIYNGQSTQQEVDFDYNSDGTVTEEWSGIDNTSIWKPNSNGGWNIISRCYDNNDCSLLR